MQVRDNYTCVANCRNYLFIERLNADSLNCLVLHTKTTFAYTFSVWRFFTRVFRIDTNMSYSFYDGYFWLANRL